MELARSWLFVPGQKQRMIEKSRNLNVDVIMLDIEDGVPPTEKQLARELITDTLDSQWPTKGPKKFVRINSIGHQRMDSDMEAVLRPGLDGLVLPKIESADEVKLVESLLESKESSSNLDFGNIELLVAVESPTGLFNARSIATASDRIIGLIFGAEDFGKELGLPMLREAEAQELIFARSMICTSAASAHIQAVDGVWPDIDDQNGLWSDTRQARRLGFTGKSLFHPSQVDAINEVFSPLPEEVEYCRQVIEAFDAASARGDGSIAFGGQLIDLPIVERARRTILLDEYLGTNQSET